MGLKSMRTCVRAHPHVTLFNLYIYVRVAYFLRRQIPNMPALYSKMCKYMLLFFINMLKIC